MEDIVVAPFLDGVLAASGDKSVVDVTNPSTGQRAFSIPAGCEVDVDRAVASSRATFLDGSWSKAPPTSRGRTLHRFADLIAAHAPALDALDAGEMGKPVSVKFCAASAAASLVRFHAEAIDKLTGEVFSSDEYSIVAQRRVPRGVVAAVVPWNFATFCAVLKIAPALAAGNCVVLKPSELSSRSAICLAQLGMQAGLPPGAFNVVPGRGDIVGRLLGRHPDVDMLAFTGSSAVGKLMLQYAGQSNMKVVQAECGGKSPQIVFDDGVDLDAAAQSIAGFLLTNQGQICSVGSRVLVQRSIEEPLLDRLRSCMERIVMGDALDPITTFGPIASSAQLTRIMRYIDTAGSDGAELVAGGRRVLEESGGYFVEPTLFRNVSPESHVAREEVFGPVLAVIPFDDEADAIRIANDTMYGLVAYVWTAQLSTAMRMAKGIHSSVIVNAVAPTGEGAGHAASFEPLGQSGVGCEGGLAGMESYLRRHTMIFNHA